MLAMYDALSFSIWRNMLRELGFDFREFVQRELEEGSLGEDGWNEASLLALFNREFVPHPYKVSFKFGFHDCERCVGILGADSAHQ